MASPGGYRSGRVGAIRQHILNLVAALPTLPQELERTRATLSLEFAELGLARILLLIGAFVALGFGAEWLFYRAASGVEAWIVALPLATVGERLRAVAVRLASGVGIVAAFAIGRVELGRARACTPVPNAQLVC